MNDKANRLSKEQAAAIYKDKAGHIKRAIKNKIAIYKPLDFKTAYRNFVKRVQEEEFKFIRDRPELFEGEPFPDDSIRHFLVEQAYYALSETYIQRIIVNKSGIADPNDIRLLEIGDFIRERLEKDGLKRLKGFKEKAGFKTFLATAVVRLLYDSWRHKRSTGEKVKKYGPDFEALFDAPADDPLSRLIQAEDEQFESKAAEFLPRILDKLDYQEKLAVKMKYEKNMKISAIARTLGRSRFKTAQFIRQIEKKISLETLSAMKTNIKGGHHEAPGR